MEKVKKSVRFAEEAQVRKYDADEAPGNNIYEVMRLHEGESVSKDAEMTVDGTTVVFEGKVPSPQKYGFHE